MTTTAKQNIMLDSLDSVWMMCPAASISIFDQFTCGFL